VFGAESLLRYSLAIVGGLAGLPAIFVPILLLRHYRSAVLAAREWDS